MSKGCTVKKKAYISSIETETKTKKMETTAKNIKTGMVLRIEGCRATGYLTVKKIKTSAKGWVKFTFDIVDGFIQEGGEFKYIDEVRDCQKWRFGSHGSRETITMHPNGKVYIAE